MRDDVRLGREVNERWAVGGLPGTDAQSHGGGVPRLEKDHPVVHRLRAHDQRLVPVVVGSAEMYPAHGGGERCAEDIEVLGIPVTLGIAQIVINVLRDVQGGRHIRLGAGGKLNAKGRG